MKLEDFRGWFAGEDCIVVGCGPSVYSFGRLTYDRHWTIGCNKSVRMCSPDFVVCVEPAYKGRDSWEAVVEVSPAFVFTHVESMRDGRKPHPRVIPLDPNSNGGRDVIPWVSGKKNESGDLLRLSQSPFFGAALAAVLGFETVGLIGVDLTVDRYPCVKREERQWGRLAEFLYDQTGAKLVNLSEESRLTSVPRGGLHDIRPKSKVAAVVR